MSTAVESNRQLAPERQELHHPSETTRGVTNAANDAYHQGAPTQLHRTTNDSSSQHLAKAKISEHSIDFGPSASEHPAGSDGGQTANHRTTQSETRSANGDTSKITYDADKTQHYSQTDAQGRLKEESVTRPDGSGEARQYGKDGSRTETSWDKNHNRTTNNFDKDGHITQSEMRSANGDTSKLRFDADKTCHYSQTDAQGRLKEESISRPDGSGEARQYGKDGSRTDNSWDKNQKGYTTKWDANGKMLDRQAR